MKTLFFILKIWDFLHKTQTDPRYKFWKFVLDWVAPLLLIALVAFVGAPSLKEFLYSMLIFLLCWSWVLHFIRKAMRARIEKGYQHYLEVKEKYNYKG